MYTATMNYPVKPEELDAFVQVWENSILKQAVKQPGFVRMHLLVQKDTALAIGTWEGKKHAEAFMSMGPFKQLMKKVENMLTGLPTPTVWEQAAYRERERDI